ncbi:MAG: hypothetical protein U0270_26825 [Labilithrix sp.]
MSPNPRVKESQTGPLEQDEEAWFADRGRESKRLLRTSPTTPPPPIGDELADRWFR